jgi:hypothetical protein
MRRIFAVTALVALVLSSGCRRPVTATPGPPAAAPKPAPPARPPLAMAAPEPISTAGIWFAFDPDFIRNRYRSADLPSAPLRCPRNGA